MLEFAAMTPVRVRLFSLMSGGALFFVFDPDFILFSRLSNRSNFLAVVVVVLVVVLALMLVLVVVAGIFFFFRRSD